MDQEKKLLEIAQTATYPITKEKLVEYIRIKGDGDDVVALAQNLPHKTFENFHEVKNAIEY